MSTLGTIEADRSKPAARIRLAHVGVRRPDGNYDATESLLKQYLPPDASTDHG